MVAGAAGPGSAARFRRYPAEAGGPWRSAAGLRAGGRFDARHPRIDPAVRHRVARADLVAGDRRGRGGAACLMGRSQGPGAAAPSRLRLTAVLGWTGGLLLTLGALQALLQFDSLSAMRATRG